MNHTIRMRIAQLALIAAGACAFASANAAEVIVVAPTAPPPAVRYEPVPVARVGYVWDKGHWRWDHGQYVWIAGHWQAERVGYHWVPGHWIQHGPNWRWVEGHWAA